MSDAVDKLLKVLKDFSALSPEAIEEVERCYMRSETVSVPLLVLLDMAKRIEALEERNKRQDSRFVALLEDGKVRLGTRSEEDPA